MVETKLLDILTATESVFFQVSVEKIKLGFAIKNVKAGSNLVMADVMIQQRENWIAIRNVLKENQEFRIVMDHASALNYPVTENAKYVKKELFIVSHVILPSF